MARNQLTTSKHTEGDNGLVGRDALLRAQLDKILSEPAFLGVIYGNSGVGKSAFARRTVDLLNGDSYPDVEAIYFEVETAQAAEEGFLELYDRIYDVVKPRGLARIRSALNDNPVLKLMKLAAGGLKDAAAKFAGDFEHTTEALTDIASESADVISQNKLRSQVQGSNFTKLINTLNAAAALTDRRFVLVLDSMERASEATIGLIDVIARRLPENIGVQLVINSEDSAFANRNFVTLKARLQQRFADSIFELPGLTAEDIVAWKQSCMGVTISPTLAEQARVESDGRPLLLQPWVESPDEGLSKISAQAACWYRVLPSAATRTAGRI
jgi:hypothetical protein